MKMKIKRLVRTCNTEEQMDSELFNTIGHQCKGLPGKACVCESVHGFLCACCETAKERIIEEYQQFQKEDGIYELCSALDDMAKEFDTNNGEQSPSLKGGE